VESKAVLLEKDYLACANKTTSFANLDGLQETKSSVAVEREVGSTLPRALGPGRSFLGPSGIPEGLNVANAMTGEYQ
jgi:hypothetical protein